MTGLSVQSTTINQAAYRQSSTSFIKAIETEANSKAATIRLDNNYFLPNPHVNASVKTKLAYTRHDHEGFRSRSAGGLIDNFIPNEKDEAAVAFIGGELAKSLRVGQSSRANFSAEIGMLATSSSDIGFSPVLDDTMAANPDVDPIGFADPVAGLSDTGLYSSFGAELNAGNRLSMSASIGTLSTERGSQQIGRVKASLKF